MNKGFTTDPPRFLLRHPDSGQYLGLTPEGRIDLVEASRAAHYPTRALAMNAQKYFGPDLVIVEASSDDAA